MIFCNAQSKWDPSKQIFFQHFNFNPSMDK